MSNANPFIQILIVYPHFLKIVENRRVGDPWVGVDIGNLLTLRVVMPLSDDFPAYS